MKITLKIALWFALAGAFSASSVGQQSVASASSEPPQTQDAGKPDHPSQEPAKNDKNQKTSIQETGEGKVAGTSNDRLFYALPNFLTLQGNQKLPPMRTKDKFKVVALGTFDYFEYPWWGALAAINQAQDSEEGFGQGWDAYAKRYGSTAGDSMVENFMVGAVFASALHQDPRFYISDSGGFMRRTGYAVSRIFVTRGDSGHSQFNASEVFGSATAAAISTFTYHPHGTFISTPTNPRKFIPSERTLSNAANVWATQLSLDTITIVVREFWPDIHRMMSRKSKTAAPPSDQR